jgi:hypothetical protein
LKTQCVEEAYFTYESSHFTFVVGGSLLENLGQHILKKKVRWSVKLTPTMSISVFIWE